MGRRRRLGARRGNRPPRARQDAALNRGDVHDVDWPGAGRHPAVIVTRQVAIPALTNVTVVLVTSTIRGLRTEVPLGPEHGLHQPCVANCDNLLTVPKSSLGALRGRLDLLSAARLDDALRIALDLD